MKSVTYYPYICSAKYLEWGVDFKVIPGVRLEISADKQYLLEAVKIEHDHRFYMEVYVQPSCSPILFNSDQIRIVGGKEVLVITLAEKVEVHDTTIEESHYPHWFPNIRPKSRFLSRNL